MNKKIVSLDNKLYCYPTIFKEILDRYSLFGRWFKLETNNIIKIHHLTHTLVYTNEFSKTVRKI